MARRIGHIAAPAAYLVKLWACAVAAAGAGWGVKLWLHPKDPVIAAVLILIPYGVVYLALAALMGIEEIGAWWKRIRRIG